MRKIEHWIGGSETSGASTRTAPGKTTGWSEPAVATTRAARGGIGFRAQRHERQDDQHMGQEEARISSERADPH